MYDGFIYTSKNDPDGAGYYTRIQSTINGETIIVCYFHLQEENRELETNNRFSFDDNRKLNLMLDNVTMLRFKKVK